jgi:hypothetical protein
LSSACWLNWSEDCFFGLTGVGEVRVAIAASAATAQELGAAALAAALEAGDTAAAKDTVDDMSGTMVQAYTAIRDLGAAWNEIAATMAEPYR